MTPEAEVGPGPPVIRVSVEKGTARKTVYSFSAPFRIGRDEECELRLSDSRVSRFHAEVRFAQGKWWLIDLKSTNGTYVNGEIIDNIELAGFTRVEFGRDGPVLSFSIKQTESDREAHPVDLSLTQLRRYYFEERPEDETAGTHTMMIRAVYGQLKKKQKRKFFLIIGCLVCLIAFLGSYAVYEHIQYDKQKALAENIFYSIKSLELDFADVLREARRSRNAQALENVRRYQARRAEMEQKYDEFLKGLDVYGKGKSEEDRLILKIARTFGECEVAMPDAFIGEIKKYIAKWKSTSRFVKAIGLAEKSGYIAPIAKAMHDNGMPPQFLYLALVESNFNVKATGPPTRFGIAKGMWQFIPTTASTYGLHIGPMAQLPQFDPGDDRYDFSKSTRAAAKYIRYIYDTEAQASGLLVMASYNWGENRVIPLIKSMPENPKDRNFWRLLSQYSGKIPRETYDYVFYIVSAAVIGENPRLFGFDFDSPLARYEH
jgi:membrane-bound lytic murein transglycosylase D